MIIFCTDLDNTLIYSYKREIGRDKTCVEIYQNREISFMTDSSYQMLKQVKEKVLLVPTTTRTLEQYERIDLGIGIPEYALVCNGGVLLVRGREDAKWYEESLKSVWDCQSELKKAEQYLQKDPNRSFEVRNIRKLFLFTKSEKPQESMKGLKRILNLALVDVFCNGVKVYVVPKRLSKGEAVRRFRERLGAEYVIAAGDSEFDVPMLKEADIAIMPEELNKRFHPGGNPVSIDESVVFSDRVLEYILKSI